MKLPIKLTSPSGLILLVVVMFSFGFLLVPLYDTFCKVTGLNGKTSGKAYQGDISELKTDNRTVTIQFVANRNASLPWHFAPQQEQITLTLGERKQTTFSVKNTYDSAVVAQAIASVAPAEAASHLHKIECFCFHQQKLLPKQGKNLPLVFFIDSDLPQGINKLTLSYTLFDITQKIKDGS